MNGRNRNATYKQQVDMDVIDEINEDIGASEIEKDGAL